MPTQRHTESAPPTPTPLPLITHRRFFKSPHFDGWYRQRRKEMARKLEALHLEAICEAVRRAEAEGAWGWGASVMGGPIFSWQNVETWMQGKSEVEVVDLVLKLREKLVSGPRPAHPGRAPTSRRP